MTLRVFKFIFKAEIGQLTLNTSVQCDLSITWKRSSQVSKSSLVPLTEGIADFNQTLTLPINMYLDGNTNSFQEKKSQFSITLHTNKGDKSAGTIIVDLSTMLNNKQEKVEDYFKLEKCPDKEAKIWIKITSEPLGESGNIADLKSVFQPNQQIPTNELISSFKNLSQSFAPKSSEQKPSLSFEERIKKLEAQNQFLKSELKAKSNIKKENDSIEIFKKQVDNLNGQVSFLKNQMTRSKTIQANLEKQLNELKSQRHQGEKELEQARRNLNEAYEELEQTVCRYL